jgi:hypothetical protein
VTAAASEPGRRPTRCAPLLLRVLAMLVIVAASLIAPAEFDDGAAVALAIVAGEAVTATLAIVVRNQLDGRRPAHPRARGASRTV